VEEGVFPVAMMDVLPKVLRGANGQPVKTRLPPRIDDDTPYPEDVLKVSWFHAA
jgi:hypothetical protein